MTIKTEMTPTQYQITRTRIRANGDAYTRVILYNANNDEVGEKWVALDLTQNEKDTILTKRDNKIAAMATANGFTEYTGD
jgi:hypothetical protein